MAAGRRAGVAATELPVLTLQNGLDSERSALRRFATVFGAVSWSPASRYPAGTDRRLDEVAADFAAAHLSLEVVPDIGPRRRTRRPAPSPTRTSRP